MEGCEVDTLGYNIEGVIKQYVGNNRESRDRRAYYLPGEQGESVCTT